jgi:hypothetical protein
MEIHQDLLDPAGKVNVEHILDRFLLKYLHKYGYGPDLFVIRFEHGQMLPGGRIYHQTKI